MRFQEFKPQQILDEGGASGTVRYNSEIGILLALAGVGLGNMNWQDPATSIPAKMLANPDRVYADIKKLVVPNYEETTLRQWYRIAQQHKPAIDAKLQELGTTMGQLGWAGGANKANNAADIAFVGSTVAGISVKAEGGITLANLTPKALGLTPERGSDIFYHYAQEEFKTMKTQIFNDVLAQAKSQPGTPLTPIKEPYSITYDPNTDKYTCAGKKTFVGDANAILAASQKNSSWQRPFGDWFQINWASKKSYATPLYNKIAKAFEVTIEQHLQGSDAIANVLRFSDVPYFYMSATGLYYVPSKEEVKDLELKGIRYAEPDGSSQLFIAQIGMKGSDKFAEIDIYVRYANGMFESNPTVRVQRLSNPQYLGWALL
jgi:hypothetical protein